MKDANIIIDGFGVDPSQIVPDPIELGGDGQPGFNCPNCKARERVFTHMKPIHDDPARYCHVAVASQEDLDIMHHYSNHCDKTKVGEPVAYRAIGIPIHEIHTNALVSLLHKSKADGVMTKTLAASSPMSQCPSQGGEGSALNVQQLTGVWVIAFLFALFGLFVRLVSESRCGMRRRYYGVAVRAIEQ